MTLTTQVDELFAQWNKPDSPGCALAIAQNGEIIYQRGYGMANLEYDIPISPDSVFDIGSNSKQFTAMCIVLLARQNLLSLDDELQKHIPEIPQYSHPITLRHLIHHTSGLRDYLELMNFAGLLLENDYPDEEILELIARQQNLNFQPGTEQLYCNTGYFLLAQIVKRVSGQTLRVFSQEHIFTPLGMNNTHFHDNFKEIVRNRADGYALRDDGGFQIEMSWLDSCGDGQLYTTIKDLSIWDRNFYHNILGDYGKDLIEEVTTLGKLNDGETLKSAFGLMISKYRGLMMINHGGSWTGYRSDLIRFPDQHFSIICLANQSTFNPTKLALQVADLYLEQEFTEKVTKLMLRTSVQSVALTTAELEIRTGSYHNPISGSTWDLEIKDEKLMVKMWDRYFQIVPIDFNHFQSIGDVFDYDIEFPPNSTQMIIQVDNGEGEGIKIQTLQKMLPNAPDQSSDYLGTYHSEELDTIYRIMLEGEKVCAKVRNSLPLHLMYLEHDSFKDRWSRFEFVRDENGLVIGFDLCGTRVRRLHFIKQSI
jgi:CubicO group peptidase (beta-lactamase class C family)